MLKPSFATSNALIKPILMGTDAKTVVYTHVNGDIQLLADIPTRQRLRSSTSDDLCVPAVRLPTVGRRAFSVAGARVWKALPVDVTSAPSLFTFRKRLKLHLFCSRILAKSAKLTFSPCVVLVVAFCYLGHPKNLLID